MSTLRANLTNDAQLALWTATKYEREFREHRAAHPWVWDELVRLALELKREGRDHYGVKALFEVARYNTRNQERDGKGFKLDNSLTALYARALMEAHPELRGFFETRALRSA